MESASTHHHHHHHHQLQDQLVASSASSCFGHPFTTTHASLLPPPFFEPKQQENSAVSSQLYTSSMAPEIAAYNWANNATPNLSTNHDSDQDSQQHSRIIEELADQYYRRYTDILSSIPQSTDNVAAKFLLKSFSYGNLMNKIPATDLYSHHDAANARGFPQILPGLHVSSLNPTAVTSLDMNLEALDRLATSRFGGNFGVLRDGFSNYGFDNMQQSHEPPFYASNKVSSASSITDYTVVEAKRNSDKLEPKAHFQNAPKKSRLEARSSCPPFKVRKEKLGDRIAALQQLVAPFGKTDTASVLMEAIGYIKFLQSQVETLSVPYMKASRNKPNRITKGGPNVNENEESKRDLKSRGLCLVPLSCLSYITDGGGAAVWPPPHFGGAT